MTTELSKFDPRLQAIQFLSKSMLPKDGRFHLGHIKVEADGAAVSTDGMRLHYVKDTGFEPCYYKVHKCTKSGALIDKVYDLDTSEGSFPDYADIIAQRNNTAHEFDVLLGASDNTPSKVFTKVVRAMTKSTVNFNFINDLCNVFDDFFTVIVPEPTSKDSRAYSKDLETDKPIHCVREGFHAAIMPVRI